MKKLIVIFLLLCTPLMAHAMPFLFDHDGSDSGTSVTVTQHLDVTGNSYIENTFTADPATTLGQVGTFTEVATFGFGSYDSDAFKRLNLNMPSGTQYQLTAVFTGGGNLFNTTAGATFDFTSGTIDMYVEDVSLSGAVAYGTNDQTDGSFNGADLSGGTPETATKIATWNLLTGGGDLNDAYVPLENGTITGEFEAVFIEAGYLFMLDGTDLKDWTTSNGSPILTMGLATLNANIFNPPDVVTGNNYPSPFGDEVAEYLGYGPNDLDLDFTDWPNTDPDQVLYLSHGGQFQLDVVPEPSTFLLLGIGLLGAARIGRRKS